MTPPAVLVSPLADWSVDRGDRPQRNQDVYGIAAHTTGSGVVDKALAQGVDPLTLVAEIYGRPYSFSGTYAIGWDGTIAAIMREDLEAEHIGFPAADRLTFLNGTWPEQVSAATANAWYARWPNVRSPAHLFPGPSPNQVYLGVELVPTSGEGAQPAPMAPGLSFTKAQHDRFAALAADAAKRWGFRSLLVPGTTRLVGHEDVNPIRRSNIGGGWDPGALRASPRFDWAYVFTQLGGSVATK